jgi:hypothetical protein
VMAMKSINDDVPSSSVASERGSVNSRDDVIPVSDDDLDAALEQQESTKNIEGEDAEAESPTKGSGPTEEESDAHKGSDLMPSQSFRLGYMGHVIIICQALVHACTNDGAKSEEPSEGGTMSEGRPEMNGELGDFVEQHNTDDQDSSPPKEGDVLNDALNRGRAADSVVTDETPSNPLILAQLVDTHPLTNRWQDFVATTLASETAIQSTPLGGFHGSTGGMMDPLHSHRPGLADDGDYSDDDGAAPPLPPRGLLVGGDVIDMDDNDLDVAASMMAGLSLGRPVEGDTDNSNDPDMLAGIPPQASGGARAGYMFDDPLGDGRFGRFDDDDDGSSSDEESELSGNTGDSGGAVFEGVSPDIGDANAEAPVMDLFAGNLDPFDDKEDSSSQQTGWSDFANFDDAFVEASTSENPLPNTPVNGVMDDVFGGAKDHAILLEELDNVGSRSKATDDLGTDEAVAMKVNTMGEDADDEPVSEREAAEDSPETSADS